MINSNLFVGERHGIKTAALRNGTERRRSWEGGGKTCNDEEALFSWYVNNWCASTSLAGHHRPPRTIHSSSVTPCAHN